MSTSQMLGRFADFLTTSGIGSVAMNQSISVAVSGNALMATLSAPTMLTFRNSTLTSGSSTPLYIDTDLSMTVPMGATLGTMAAVTSRIVWLLAYNEGTPVLCVVNLNGAPNLDETTLISPMLISDTATMTGIIYSASAVTPDSPFRVVGFSDVMEATAGTWAAGPTTVQGVGGQALAAMSS